MALAASAGETLVCSVLCVLILRTVTLVCSVLCVLILRTVTFVCSVLCVLTLRTIVQRVVIPLHILYDVTVHINLHTALDAVQQLCMMQG